MIQPYNDKGMSLPNQARALAGEVNAYEYANLVSGDLVENDLANGRAIIRLSEIVHMLAKQVEEIDNELQALRRSHEIYD